MSPSPENSLLYVLTHSSPEAVAVIHGNAQHPNLVGLVSFYHTPYTGVMVTAEITGLPTKSTKNPTNFYAMHIHENGNCTPPFDQTGMHYNPQNQEHPEHAGDFPPLLGNDGYAWCAFYDTRFTISEIIGRSVIIHSNRDDFTSQPAGDSGDKIGCGVIALLNE